MPDVHSFRFVPFRPWHVTVLWLRRLAATLREAPRFPSWRQIWGIILPIWRFPMFWIHPGPALTVRSAWRSVACAGVGVHETGIGLVWIVKGPEFDQYFTQVRDALATCVDLAIEDYQLRRIRARVRAEDFAMQRLVEELDLFRELTQYGFGKHRETVFVYSKVVNDGR